MRCFTVMLIACLACLPVTPVRALTTCMPAPCSLSVPAGEHLHRNTYPAAHSGQADREPIEIDQATLLARPALLHRAMLSAIQSGYLAGILALLPVYEQLPDPDSAMLSYARAIRARSQNRPDAAAQYYDQLLARVPNAHGLRLQLADALIADYQHRAARQQLDLLHAENLPDTLGPRLADLRQRLHRRESWRLHAGVTLLNEHNLNSAPSQRRLGNWTFDAPIHDQGFGYHAGAEKNWFFPYRHFYALDISAYGRHYARHSRYNDFILRLSPGTGLKNARNTLRLGPYTEYRLFGGHAYSHTVGASAQWDYRWTSTWQTLAAWEYAHQRHSKHRHLDNRQHKASLSLVYTPGPGQYWLLGHELYTQTGARDPGNSFQHLGLRAAWGQAWASGIGTWINVGSSLRRYRGPTLFSEGIPKRDTQRSIALSIWHQRIRYANLTPRLSLSHHRMLSNDTLFGNRKTRVTIEASRQF